MLQAGSSKAWIATTINITSPLILVIVRQVCAGCAKVLYGFIDL